MNINAKDYKQNLFFLDLKAQGFIKTSQHQTCRSIYKENNKIGLVFFWFFYIFLGILELHCKKNKRKKNFLQ